MAGPGLFWNPFTGSFGFGAPGDGIGPGDGGPIPAGGCGPLDIVVTLDGVTLCCDPTNPANNQGVFWITNHGVAGIGVGQNCLIDGFPCGVDPEITVGIQKIAGPFSTHEAAQAWMDAHPDLCKGGSTLPAGGGGGSCPQCGCVTCQCSPQDQGKSCYQDPNGNYYWLGPNDEVPPSFTSCQVTTPTQAVQTPEEQPGQEVGTVDASCIIGMPWGSPDWCKCAEQLRVAFEEYGAAILNLISSETADPAGDQWNIIYRAFVLMDVYKEMRQASFAELVPLWLSNLRRMYGWVTSMYGDNSPALFGVYALRAAIETVLSLEGGITLSDDYKVDIGVGLHAVGFGVTTGATQAGSGHFSVSAKMKLDHVLKVLDQLVQYYVPVGILSTGDALQLYYTSEIDGDGLRCMFAAAGVHPNFAQPMAWAEREQPSAFEYIMAWRRGILTDKGLSESLRGRGWISDTEQNIMVGITEFLPPPTDLIRFMLRNIGDPAIVQQFQLAAEFDLLYRGDIVTWAKAAGISEDVLRAYHEAHWTFPAPSELALFWQRFGENRHSPQANALPAKMTRLDYERALREQGIAPYWRPFYIAAQYAILGRRDLQWGYQFGQIDDQGLQDGFLDAGYRPDLALQLVEVTKQRTVLAWARDPVVRGYVKAGLNRAALQTYLVARGVSAETQSAVIEIVELEATELANEEAIKLIEKTYETGGLDELQLLQALQALQLDQEQVDRIVLIVHQKKSVRPKQIPAHELCQWYGARLISRPEFLLRLVTLGYIPLDAELIVAKCEADLSARQLRTEQLQLKSQSAAERRRLKDLSIAERQAQLAKDRAAKALAAQIRAQRQADRLLQTEQAKEQMALERAIRRKEALAQQAEREELRVLSSMEFITDHWSKKTGEDSAALMPELQLLLAQATADGTVTVVELLAALRQLLAGKPTDLPGQLSDLVALALGQVQSVPEAGPATATSGGTLDNGSGPGLPIR